MSDEKQNALDGEISKLNPEKELQENIEKRTYEKLKDYATDMSYENEVTPSPMVSISLKEYDKLKEKQHYITDKTMIDIIDNLERLVRALRKHIVRTEI